MVQPSFDLPPNAQVYRRIGPFDQTSLPRGLLHEHSLKEGTWAQVDVLSGKVGFVWDDAAGAGSRIIIPAGQSMVVPPVVSHHLEPGDGPFLLEIAFLSVPA